MGVIAQWIHQSLPYCAPGSNPKHKINVVFQFVVELDCGNEENKENRP